jgi:hypothetical protein
MKLSRVKCLAALAILVFVGMAPLAGAQDKQAAAPDAKKMDVSLKVTVVVTELDGTRKLSSLPYTFFVNVDDRGGHQTSSVRMGLRVPVTTSANQFQYMDIGTNLDCAANSTTDSRYKLALSVDRTALALTDDKKGAALASEGVSLNTANPIVEHFSSSYNLMIHDGQTIEATSTSDPISGHVLQILVTVNAVK